MAKRRTPDTTTAASILETHSPPVRESVERLRVLIRATVPDAIESAHAVWHSLSYKHPASGYFCGIFPQPDRVDVAFEFGVLLPDPARVLEGNGKQVRYLRVKAVSDFNESAFKQLLIEAIDLPPKREAKLALIRARQRMGSG